MPPLVGALGAGAVTMLSGGTFLGFTGLTAGLLSAASSLVLSGLSKALAPKPSSPGAGAFANLKGGAITRQIRQPLTPRRMVFGEMRVSGPYAFIGSTNENQYLHFIIMVASHEVDQIGEIWVNDDSIALDKLDASGDVTSGKYYKTDDGPFLRIVKVNGTSGQAALSNMTSAFPEWTSNHRLQGIAYIYARLKYNSDIYASGIPNISAWVRGYKTYDSRTNGYYWHHNPMMILRSYLADTSLGIGIPDAKFNDDFTDSGANECEEFVTTTDISHAGSSANATTDIITLDGETLKFQTGDRVTLDGGSGVPPPPLVGATNYYVITYQRRDTPRIKLAATYSDAINGTAIDITSASFDRTNLCLQSQTLDNASWTKTRSSITANSTTAPDSTSTADSFVEDATASNTHQMLQSISFTAGTEYTFSIYAKKNSREHLRLVFPSAAFSLTPFCTFDLNLGTMATPSDCTSAIESVGSGWYRCSITATADITSSGNIILRLGTSLTTVSYSGDGTSNLYLWGAQVEAYPSATAYIATTTAPVSVSGSLTVTKNAEPRYSAGGIVDSDGEPQEIISGMLSAMSGKALYTGGKWTLKAGAYETPTLSFDEGDLVSGYIVNTKISRRDRFNSIMGTYTSPLNNGQPADYPKVKNDTYIEEDGVAINRAFDLPFTQRPHTAQRLAKIDLEKSRQEITFKARFKLTAFKCMVGDNILLSIARMGWTDKAFEVIEWSLNDEIKDGAPTPFIEMTLKETASTVYDWNNGEETQTDPAPNTDLPDAFTVSGVVGLVFNSYAVETLDGDFLFQIILGWDAHSDSFVLEGGQFEIQYKLSTETNYRPSFFVAGNQTESEIVRGGVNTSYDLRIRAVNNLGVRSSWNSLTGILAGSSGGITSSEDWGTPWGSVGSSEDYGTPWGSVSSSEDWGGFV